MLNCELRPGSQHSNKEALEFIKCSLDMIKDLGIDLNTTLVRLESAHQLISLTLPEKTIQGNELPIEPFSARLLKIM